MLKEFINNPLSFSHAYLRSNLRLTPISFSHVEISKRLSLNKQTISNIWTQRDKIKNHVKNHSQTKRKSGDVFKCITGWIDRLKKRHNVVVGKILGQAASISIGETNSWLSSVWPLLCKDYEEKDIFNADGTDIFYKLTPDKTLIVKGEKCVDGKLAKDRITVLVCVNLDGSEKRKLLVIGKFQKSRYLKNCKTLSTDYTNRKILLLVDNCSAYSRSQLRNIKLDFSPPNSTAVLQPLDQGVIWSLKQAYRKDMLRKIIQMQEVNGLKKLAVLDAMNILSLKMKCEWIEIQNLLYFNNIDQFLNYVRVDAHLIKEVDDDEIEEATELEAFKSFQTLQKYFQQRDSQDEVLNN
ncbi:tigger transposable element-derived protein 6-like [Euwallacea similis]|uniref:tigger transposable element-derived protein 6-like n=1 Tax=Euwallacea similis TaxID=1736056 RepID=UPI00344DE8C0